MRYFIRIEALPRLHACGRSTLTERLGKALEARGVPVVVDAEHHRIQWAGKAVRIYLDRAAITGFGDLNTIIPWAASCVDLAAFDRQAGVLADFLVRDWRTP